MKRIVLCKVVVIFMVVLFSSAVFASEAPDGAKKEKILNKAYSLRVPFIENRGQIENQDVDFYAKTFGGTVFVEEGGILTYYLPSEDKGAAVIKEILTENEITIRGLEPSSTKVNYFKGKDESKWKTNIPSFESISLGEIYKGIELTLRAYGNNVEKLFTVLSEGKPEIIRIKLEGAKGLRVNEKGELEVITELGSVKFTKPLAYQEIDGKRIEIAAAYSIKNPDKLIPQSAIRNPQSAPGSLPSAFSYGFKVGDYNNNYPLIIDPLLASTFIGGSVDTCANDNGKSIAIDGSGNVYIAGYTYVSDYPTTAGAYSETTNGGRDVFVSKFDSDLSSLLASTFIGGSSGDHGYYLVLDGSDNVYLTGNTMSSDFPITPGAYDESRNGSWDGFISKLDSNLTTLLKSTFIGGAGSDTGNSLVLDGGNVYLTGSTSSSNYPTTTGAYDESHNGSNDVFVSKLDSNLSSLLKSTFIGGSESDSSVNMVLDGSGNVYVTGDTGSSDFPTTTGAYDETFNEGQDIIVSKLDSTLTTLSASTFIGGTGSDYGKSIDLDGSNVYVTGYTYSSDFPTTSGAYDDSHNGGKDVFVSKLDSDLSNLSKSTFIGGNGGDSGNSLVLDGGNVYVTGETGSSDYPTTTCAYDETYNGGFYDVFVSKFDSTLGNLEASTFIGGNGDDSGNSLVLDGGNVYVTGLRHICR